MRVRTSAVQVFSKEAFWLLLLRISSLLDVVYETIFQVTRSDDVIFMNN